MRKSMQKLGRWLFSIRSFTPVPIILLIFFFFPPFALGRAALPVMMGGLFISSLGILIRAMAVGFAHSGTSGRESFLRADRLNTTGFYSMCRNPLYLGNILMFNGLVIVYGNPWALLVCNLFLWSQYTMIILSEEAYLVETHGEEYRQYRARVPRRMIPRLQRYRGPELTFRWKRMLVKENSSILNWGVMLTLILAFRDYSLNRLPAGLWVYVPMLAFFVLLYLGIKFLRKRWFGP
jgi:protein-S-isoprenylcysteine O-methyltransferase Ste14